VLTALAAPITASHERAVWLRRGSPAHPAPSGSVYKFALSTLGNAAARETFVCATPHMAGIWTDLFASLVSSGPDLRWQGSGPGIGRDAKAAYSGLLGRFMARAYLTDFEGVRALVPLDVAKRRLQGSNYEITKVSGDSGLEADWVGIDATGLVIVEAKGTYDRAIKRWRNAGPPPDVVETGKAQASRTAVYRLRPRAKLPARRWAVASRWATETPMPGERGDRAPTLIAWDPEEEELNGDDFRKLCVLLLDAELEATVFGLGFPQSSALVEAVRKDVTGVERRLRYGEQDFGPGLVSLIGLNGVRPLREPQDFELVERARSADLNFAVASLSSTSIRRRTPEEPIQLGEERPNGERWATIGGLTVIWPRSDEPVGLA